MNAKVYICIMKLQDTTYRAITKEDFDTAMSTIMENGISLKDSLYQKLAKVSAVSGINYQKVRDTMRADSKVADPWVLGSILRGCNIVYNELAEQYAEMAK